jgi:hypothetical protein
MAFSVDAPNAYPPQSILLAVIPDQSRGWALDLLFDVVQDRGSAECAIMGSDER